MRVLFLQRGHPYYTSQLSSALCRLGHDVAIILDQKNPDYVGTGDSDRKADYLKLLDPRVQVFWVELSVSSSLRDIIAGFKSMSQISRLIGQYRPDVIHVHDEADYRLYGGLALSGRNPTVLVVHDPELHPGYKANKSAGFVKPRMRHAAERVIVHGEDIKKRLLDVDIIPENRIRVVNHGAYDLYLRWRPVESSSKGLRVLFFGRILEYKGLEYLIKAAPEVVEQVPGVKFVIAGSGPDWQRCKGFIETPDIFVIHDCNVLDSDVARLFHEASVVVLPYIEASQSGVLAIAYAFGVPSVVTNVGSLPEVVHDGETGLVVAPRDSHALAEALVKLLTDSDLRERMGRNAQYEAENGALSWDSIAAETVNVYHDAMRSAK